MISLKFHCSIHGSTVVTLFDAVAFVILLFASCYGYGEFGQSFFVEEESGGYDGVSGCLRCDGEAGYLLRRE